MTMAEWMSFQENDHGRVDEYLEQGWEFIQKGIKKLVSEQPINSEEYILIYTTVYNLCTEKPPHDYPKQLYDRYRKSIEDYIAKMILPALRNTPSEFFWGELMKRCEYYTTVVSWLSRFLGYLDQHFVIRRSLPTLNEVGLTCFRDLVHQEMKDKIKDAVITLIDGNKIDRDMSEKVDSIIVEFGNGCIGKDFEVAILEVAATYYSGKAPLWFKEKSYQAYLEQVNECLDRLENRVKRDLRSPSKQKWLEKVQSELLSPYKSQLLEKRDSDCRTLLRDGKVKELSDMYKLFHRIPEGLARIFKEHVTGEVASLVKRAEDAATNKKAEKDMVGAQVQELVRDVIELYAKYLQYVGNCTHFYVALKEAFELFCNKGVAGSRGDELLATFCDNILKRGGSENMSNENIQDTLEKVAKFVANISDKDFFEQFYREKLARRFLFDKSAKYDHESILTKLKQHCGSQFTSKMEHMIEDLTSAKENQGHFEDYLKNNPRANPGIDLTVTVLTTWYWPSYKSSDLNLPAEMVRCIEVFKQFYQESTIKRKLTWIYSLGTCIINGNFDPEPKELVVTTYQASALLLFNASERLSYSEVKSQLNLTDEDIARLLHSLSCAKYKILNKEPNTKTVAQTDYFEFNSKFTDKRKRIQIPPPVVYERKKVIEDVGRDRRHEIDASIVRIMKKRKVLGHQQLVEECLVELGQTFKPDPKAIKKQIEDLITREYLERDKDNRKSYRYLA